MAVSLQTCQSELQSTRLSVRESQRAAESAKTALLHLAAQQHSLTRQALKLEHGPNTVYSILFPFADAHISLPPTDAHRLIEAARSSAWIVLRGRTDGLIESSTESRVARQRSESMRSYLVQAGVDPARIRTTWQPVGDHAADNAAEAGRRLNRRVEIELYAAPPRLASSDPVREL